MTHTNTTTNDIKAEPVQAGDIALCGSVPDALDFIKRLSLVSTKGQLATMRREQHMTTYIPQHVACEAYNA